MKSIKMSSPHGRMNANVGGDSSQNEIPDLFRSKNQFQIGGVETPLSWLKHWKENHWNIGKKIIET